MNEIVEKYLERKLDEKNDNEVKLSEMELKKREDFLIKEGLFEKIYSDSTEYDDEYPEIEYLKSGDFRYYKRVMIDLTEEEWEAVLAAYNETKDISKSRFNKVSLLVWAIRIISVLVIIGYIPYIREVYGDFASEYALVNIAEIGVKAAILFGVGEIIRYLEEINKKIK